MRAAARASATTELKLTFRCRAICSACNSVSAGNVSVVRRLASLAGLLLLIDSVSHQNLRQWASLALTNRTSRDSAIQSFVAARVNRYSVGYLAVDRKYDIEQAPIRQTRRKRNIHLIEARILTLRADIQHWDRDAAYCATDA